MKVSSLVACAVAFATGTAAEQTGWPVFEAKAWPTNFTMVQLGRTFTDFDKPVPTPDGKGLSTTHFHYSFPNLHLIDGEGETHTWHIGGTMYTYTTATDKCVKIPLGMGIPRPNWMLTDEYYLATQFLHNSEDPLDDGWKYTGSITKQSPVINFNYFYLPDGTPYRMLAPGPFGPTVVMNQYSNFKPNVQYAEDEFTVPAACGEAAEVLTEAAIPHHVHRTYGFLMEKL